MGDSVSSVNTLEEVKVTKGCPYVQMPVQRYRIALLFHNLSANVLLLVRYAAVQQIWKLVIWKACGSWRVVCRRKFTRHDSWSGRCASKKKRTDASGLGQVPAHGFGGEKGFLSYRISVK